MKMESVEEIKREWRGRKKKKKKRKEKKRKEKKTSEIRRVVLRKSPIALSSRGPNSIDNVSGVGHLDCVQQQTTNKKKEKKREKDLKKFYPKAQESRVGIPPYNTHRKV